MSLYQLNAVERLMTNFILRETTRKMTYSAKRHIDFFKSAGNTCIPENDM